MPDNQFEIIKRQTIKELIDTIDPLTLQENIRVLQRSRNIIFEGAFDDDE